jgi:uncharacterized membrane protein YdbT with pleckstrin-like domain
MAQTEPSDANVREDVLFEGHPALLSNLWQLIASILTLGLLLLYFWVRAKSVHYRITSQRVVVETGLLSKRLEQIDLYRIQDYAVERPLGQRIMGNGNLVLMTADRTSSILRLTGLPTDVVGLYERLRKATEQEKRRRGVRVLDTDHV